MVVQVNPGKYRYGPAWTLADEKAYRREVERRFRLRTPPPDVCYAHWGDRVTRSEMRTWSMTTLGRVSPVHWDLMADRAAWYRRMARREDPGHPSWANEAKGESRP